VIKNRNKYLLIPFIGILLGTLTYLLPVFLILFILFGAIILFLLNTNSEDRPILTKIVFIGLALRCAFSFFTIINLKLIRLEPAEHPIIFKVIGHTVQLFRDFHREVLNSINMVKYFADKSGLLSLEEIAVEGHSSFLHLGAYIQGFLNYILGESVLNLFVYPLLSIWVVIVVYFLAKEFFNKNVAILASLIVAFLPSLIIWSSINIRMSITIASLAIIGLFSAKFRKSNKVRYLVMVAIALALVYMAKDKIILPTSVITVFILLTSIKINKIMKNTIFFIIVIISLYYIMENHSLTTRPPKVILKLITHQRDFATYASGSNYKIYDEYVYLEDIEKSEKIYIKTVIKALPKGVAYFLFSPFPWKITNTLRLYSYPQILLNYFMFPFFILGILIGLRYSYDATYCMLLLFIFFTIIYSLSMGNVGTVARHRDLVSPFFFIFASAGICNLLGCLEVPKEEKTKDLE
jgi:hypothetical protein